MGSVEIGAALIGNGGAAAMCAGPGLAAKINGAGGNVCFQDPGEWAVMCEQVAKRERSLSAQRVRQTACGSVKPGPEPDRADRS
jgi:hypothetical protein